MSSYVIFGFGFLAQILFTARLLVQWIKSEKAGRVLSPTLFWQLSLLASILMMIYGVLRTDFVIILGQVFSYFVYIRNLQYKNAWSHIPYYFKLIVVAFPVLAFSYLAFWGTYSFDIFFNNPDISTPLLIWGSLGQVVFAFRFLYQWYHSEKINKSILPFGFWIISTAGSMIIVGYAIMRYDPVLFIGQIFGTIMYVRNILISLKSTSVGTVEADS